MGSLGQRIKDAREAKRLYQSDLAGLIGVKSAAVISNWEKNINKPDAEKLVKLCKVLDISLSYLLDYTGKGQSFDLSIEEQELIRKYRALDLQGKIIVNDTITDKLRSWIEIQISRNQQPQDSLLLVHDQIIGRISNDKIENPASKKYNDRTIEELFVTNTLGFSTVALPTNEIPEGTDIGIYYFGIDLEPEIEDNSIIFVQKCDNLKASELGVFTVKFFGQGSPELYCGILDCDKKTGNESIMCTDGVSPIVPDMPEGSISIFGKVLGAYKR